ncbi:peptidase family M54 protein (macronuclear) [Tetrahymena thermophila SB210]|uniref:Peptidase family M54 protein n=1 Tax=Tetrahymena thermophila (strain SB210) TaxID=312017 RepID=Q245E1_TETTS|nr:peptidase family M54 protein [Tetrahymena thermophila SB210]EAS03423.1 peptidase family M54 protein [Tetrahymena thermophila SB210]|eukprot:XP_001023668.1 peptidase family M54 protein [Tetrahymena thermophila SB210]
MQKKQLFSQPTQQQREKALGDLSSLSQKNQTQIKKIIGYFKPVPNPYSDDWLYNQKEEGQTFDKYIEKPRTIDTKKRKIYIQPLEQDINKEFVDKLKIFASAFFFGIKVDFLPLLEVEKLGVKTRINENKKQFYAPKILELLKESKPKDAYCIIGICMTDIYNKESWNFVFGLASLQEKVGVFSFARYQESFYYPKAQVDQDLVIYRSCKVMCHEVVHQFGIKHCIYYHCIMNGSNHYEESGSKPFQLCPVCLRKMQYALQFDLADRYRALIQATETLKNKYFSQELFIYKNLVLNENLVISESSSKLQQNQFEKSNNKIQSNNK